MKKYKEYRRTGDFKLKEVPSHWQLTVLKRATEFKYGDALQSETRDDDGDVNVYGSNGIVGKHNSAITQAPCIIIGRKGSYGKVNYSKEPCFPIDTAYFIDETVTNNDLRFIYYLVQTCELDTNSRDSAVPGLSREEAYNKKIALPPLPEQRAIAAYLDHKTAQLDTLLTQKEALLQLLHKKREAIINEAVTQGLDPTAPRKPSGVAWLGDVPAHWGVRRLKTVSKFVTSGSRGWAEYYSDEGAVFLRIGNLSTSSIDLKLHNLQRVTPPAGAEGERTRVQANDLLISITALLGAVGVVPIEVQYAYVNQHTALVRLKLDLIHPRWAAYFLISAIGQHQFKTLTNGGTKEGLTLGDVANLILLYPTYSEQLAIVDLIESKVSKINKAATAIHTQIQALKDYRQSLISEVVTGKVDVRAAEPVAPEADLPLWRHLV